MQEIPLVLDMQFAAVGQGTTIVLENVNFALGEAEMAYIIGKSGSGKSTFLKTLYGALPIMSGSAQIAGFDLAQADRRSIPMMRRKIGMVFQQFHLFDKWSVSQNLDYALKAIEWKDETERKSRVEEVLDQIRMLDKRDTPVYQLSGGEQQKVVIGRAVLNRPPILIADEPTGNLDPESSEEIMTMLYQVVAQNKTALLIATHDHILMDKFPARVYVCKDRTITEQ